MTLLWLRRGRLWVLLPLAVTLGLSVLLFLSASRQGEEAVLKAFQERARTLASAVRASCESHLEVLVSLNALFASVPEISEEEFGKFVAMPLRRHP